MIPKLSEIVKSLEGITTPLQRRLFAQIIDHIDDMTRHIADMDDLIKNYMDQYDDEAVMYSMLYLVPFASVSIRCAGRKGPRH